MIRHNSSVCRCGIADFFLYFKLGYGSDTEQPLFIIRRLCPRKILPKLLIISLAPVPCLSPLDSQAPHYFTRSSPLFVSARLPSSSLFHSLQSLVCLRSTPKLLIISLAPVPYLSPLAREKGLCGGESAYRGGEEENQSRA